MAEDLQLVRLSTEFAEHLRGLLLDDNLDDALRALRARASSAGTRRELFRGLEDEYRTAKRGHRAGTLALADFTAEKQRLRLRVFGLVGELELKADAASDDEAPSAYRTTVARTPLLDCVDLAKRYPGRFSLPRTTFSLAAAEILAVIGQNGSGKTTLLRILAGELSSTSGKIEYRPVDEAGRRIENLRVLVPQQPPEWTGTLKDHLRLQAAFYGYSKTNEDVVERALIFLDLERYADHRWGQLSGGYKMRAAIAAALVAKPAVLILDEPLAPLDPQAQQKLLLELQTIAIGERTAIILSSQNVTEAESIADRVLLFSESESEVFVPGEAREGHGLFEVAARDRKQFAARVEELARSRPDIELERYPSMSVVRTEAQLGLDEVVDLMKGVELTHVRSLHGSTLARLYQLGRGRDE